MSPIEGLIDFHNHNARAVDDDESAQLNMARGMEACVLKNHVATTVAPAWLVSKPDAGIKDFAAHHMWFWGRS